MTAETVKGAKLSPASAGIWLFIFDFRYIRGAFGDHGENIPRPLFGHYQQRLLQCAGSCTGRSDETIY